MECFKNKYSQLILLISTVSFIIGLSIGQIFKQQNEINELQNELCNSYQESNVTLWLLHNAQDHMTKEQLEKANQVELPKEYNGILNLPKPINKYYKFCE